MQFLSKPAKEKEEKDSSKGKSSTAKEGEKGKEEAEEPLGSARSK